MKIKCHIPILFVYQIFCPNQLSVTSDYDVCLLVWGFIAVNHLDLCVAII